MNRARRNERGGVTVEAAVLTPAVALFIALVFFGGRVGLAHNAVDAAAADAARTASLARDPNTAAAQARETGKWSLQDRNVRCASSTVDVDTSAFAAPIGTLANIEVDVRCVIDLSDLSLPGMPGTMTIEATASSPLDAYRSRS